ncbi:hypothetical protein ACFQE1_02360 [Halobium palmae]|uniref:DUF3156 family protein n=1 Tax=Halobium palmae TaxID=1776492 RepID=A0ABD5RV25_9EURY
MSVGSLFGSRGTWSSFCGVDQSVFEEQLRAALDTSDYEYRREEGPGSFMLGQEASGRYTVDTPDGDVEIRVYYASGDPMLRFLSSFRSGGDEALGGVCVVRVRGADEGVEPHLRHVFSAVADRLPRAPDEVAHHPRFRIAPLARWRIRRQWRRWLDD